MSSLKRGRSGARLESQRKPQKDALQSEFRYEKKNIKPKGYSDEEWRKLSNTYREYNLDRGQTSFLNDEAVVEKGRRKRMRKSDIVESTVSRSTLLKQAASIAPGGLTRLQERAMVRPRVSLRNHKDYDDVYKEMMTPGPDGESLYDKGRVTKERLKEELEKMRDDFEIKVMQNPKREAGSFEPGKDGMPTDQTYAVLRHSPLYGATDITNPTGERQEYEITMQVDPKRVKEIGKVLKKAFRKKQRGIDFQNNLIDDPLMLLNPVERREISNTLFYERIRTKLYPKMVQARDEDKGDGALRLCRYTLPVDKLHKLIVGWGVYPDEEIEDQQIVYNIQNKFTMTVVGKRTFKTTNDKEGTTRTIGRAQKVKDSKTGMYGYKEDRGMFRVKYFYIDLIPPDE